MGVAPCQLGASYPHMAWMVAVTQAEEDLYSPVRSLLWRLMAAFGVVAGVVLVGGGTAVALSGGSDKPKKPVAEQSPTTSSSPTAKSPR